MPVTIRVRFYTIGLMVSAKDLDNSISVIYYGAKMVVLIWDNFSSF